MSTHFFPVPVQCQECGTVVDDPAAEKCPRCGALLKERRTPSRLAGVARRHAQVRVLLVGLRFLAWLVLLTGLLLALYDEGELSRRLVTLLGTVVLTVGLFVVAAFIEIMLDIEENTRASFRLHLEERDRRR